MAKKGRVLRTKQPPDKDSSSETEQDAIDAALKAKAQRPLGAIDAAIRTKTKSTSDALDVAMESRLGPYPSFRDAVMKATPRFFAADDIAKSESESMRRLRESMTRTIDLAAASNTLLRDEPVFLAPAVPRQQLVALERMHTVLERSGEQIEVLARTSRDTLDAMVSGNKSADRLAGRVFAATVVLIVLTVVLAVLTAVLVGKELGVIPTAGRTPSEQPALSIAP